jgi:hypothetical protein
MVQLWTKGRRQLRWSFLILLPQREKRKLPNPLAEPGWSGRGERRWMLAREAVFTPPRSIPETEKA